MALRIVPVTPDRRDDLIRLFGPSGAYSNCWCTWWVFSAKEFDAATPGERRRRLEEMVASGLEPGLLGFHGEEPVGWVAVGPRTQYARMQSKRSRVFRPLDDEPSWVINCFFVPREQRGTGIASALLDAAVSHAFARGAERIDAYPLDPSLHSATSSSLFVGSLPMFLAAGFEEIARMGGRPVVSLRRPYRAS